MKSLGQFWSWFEAAYSNTSSSISLSDQGDHTQTHTQGTQGTPLTRRQSFFLR